VALANDAKRLRTRRARGRRRDSLSDRVLPLYACTPSLPGRSRISILAVIAMLTAMLAVLQNSIAFALLAVSGGSPGSVLASTGQGSHVVLFSYYAVLNFGILAVAWFKAWRH